MLFRYSFTLVLLLLSFELNAQTCCSGGIPLANNLGMEILDKGSFQFSLNYDYNNLNTLNSGTETLDDDSRLRITHSVLLNMSYSITNRLSIEGLLTWVNQRRNIMQFGNEDLDQTSGIGDGVFLIKYSFPNILGENSEANFGLGTKIPMGSSTELNSEGLTLAADLQPGSGAWDMIYWGSASKNFGFRPSLTLSTMLIYRATGINEDYLGSLTYEFGNVFQAFLGVSDQFVILNTLINPGLIFKYRDADFDKVNGFDLDNTGGNWLFVIPNFSINLAPGLAFVNRLELPLFSNVEGTQLTPTLRLTSGLLFTFFPKQQVLSLN